MFGQQQQSFQIRISTDWYLNTYIVARSGNDDSPSINVLKKLHLIQRALEIILYTLEKNQHIDNVYDLKKEHTEPPLRGFTDEWAVLSLYTKLIRRESWWSAWNDECLEAVIVLKRQMSHLFSFSSRFSTNLVKLLGVVAQQIRKLLDKLERTNKTEKGIGKKKEFLNITIAPFGFLIGGQSKEFLSILRSSDRTIMSFAITCYHENKKCRGFFCEILEFVN